MSQKEERTPPEVYLAHATELRRKAAYHGFAAANFLIERAASGRPIEGEDEARLIHGCRLVARIAEDALLLEEAARLAAQPPQAPEFGPALQRLLNFCEALRRSGMPVEKRGREIAAGALAMFLDDFAREDALARLQEDR